LYDSDFDILVKNWQKANLKLKSVIRVHKIATLEKQMIEKVLGKIDNDLKKDVKLMFRELAE